MRLPPNKPDAANPAIASRVQRGDHWRGVADPERSPKQTPMQRVTQSDEEVVEQARRVVIAKRKLRWVMLLYAVLFLGLCGYFTVAGIRKIEGSDGEQLSLGFVYGLAMAVAWVSFGVIGGLCLGKFLTGFRGDFRLQELVVS